MPKKKKVPNKKKDIKKQTPDEKEYFWQKLKRLTKNSTLDLHGIIFSKSEWAEVVSYLNDHSDINRLVANGCEIEDATVEHIALAKNLSSIDLQENNIHSAGAAKLAQLSLEELNLSLNPINDKVLAFFSSSKIKKLSLNCCENIEGQGLAFLFKNPNILILELEELNIENDSFCSLKENTTLKELNIRNCQYLTYKVMDYLGKNKSLEKIDISLNTNIGDIGIEKLSSSNNLQSLILCQIGLTDNSINALIKMQRLSFLNAKLNNFTEQGIEILREKIEKVMVSSTESYYADFALDLSQENNDEDAKLTPNSSNSKDNKSNVSSSKDTFWTSSSPDRLNSGKSENANTELEKTIALSQRVTHR
jgi:hypothetical protein